MDTKSYAKMKTAMSKKSKNLMLSGMLVLFLLTISIGSVSAGVSGFANVDVVSNCPANQCPLFNSDDGVWVFNWIDNGFSSETINANFDKDDDLKVDDKTAEQDFSISIDGSDNFCTYDINREADRQDIHLFELKEFDETFWLWEIDTVAEQEAKAIEIMTNIGCSGIGNSNSFQGSVRAKNVFVPVTRKLYGACWAIKDTIGQAGSLQNLRFDFETTFTLNAEGKQEIRKTLSYSSGEGTSGISELLSNDAYVVWDGNLNSGETCPTGADEYMNYNPNTFDWTITDRLNYILYENKLSSLSQLADDVVQDARSVYNAEQIINSASSKAVSPRSLSYSPIIDSYSSNNGQLKVKLGKRIIFPQFRLFVDSDYLELEISTGVPELSKDFLGNCKPDGDVNFNMGDLFGGQFDVGLKNAGTKQSSFLVKVLSCTNPLISPGSSDVLNLNGGTSENAKLSVVGQLDDVNNVKGSCTVEAEDIISGVKDTCTVSIDVSKPATCVNGRQTCSIKDANHVIKECIGGNMDVIETCQSTEICDYDEEGAPVCVLADPDDPGIDGYCSDCDTFMKSKLFGWASGETCKEKTFQNMFFCIFAFLRLLAVPLFFIASLLFGFNAINKIMKGEYKALSWSLAIIVGALVGVLTYFAFYIGLAILIVLVIARIIIGFIPGLNFPKRNRK